MLILIFCAGALFSSASCQKEDDFLSKLAGRVQFGVQLASQFFGFDPNQSLVNTFALSLQKLNNINNSNVKSGPKGEEEKVKMKQSIFIRDGFLSAIIRSMGFNYSKINDVAVNVVLFIIKMVEPIGSRLSFQITQALAPTKATTAKKKRDGRTFSPMQLMMSQTQVSRLVTFMQDPQIVDRLLSEMNSRLDNYAPKDVECIKLLVCKTSPFVWGMQKSLKFFMKKEKKETERSLKGDDGSLNTNENYQQRKDLVFTYEKFINPEKENDTKFDYSYQNKEGDSWRTEQVAWDTSQPLQRLYLFLPTLKEVVKHGDTCEDRYPSCTY